MTLKSFNIDEIKETLRFAESYVKGQEDLNIQYIYKYCIFKDKDIVQHLMKIKWFFSIKLLSLVKLSYVVGFNTFPAQF